MLRREARDDVAFAAWVEANGAGLLRVAYLLTGDGHQAEELVQAVLARALPVWADVAAKGDPAAYVRRALVNERTDAWRARGRREAPAADVPVRDHPDHAPGADLRHDLLAALQRLPHRQRAVVVLRYLEDMSDDAIAGLLRCSPVTVRTQASRALVKLRPLLAADVPEGCASA